MCGCWIVKVSVSNTSYELALERHAGLTLRSCKSFKLRHSQSTPASMQELVKGNAITSGWVSTSAATVRGK